MIIRHQNNIHLISYSQYKLKRILERNLILQHPLTIFLCQLQLLIDILTVSFNILQDRIFGQFTFNSKLSHDLGNGIRSFPGEAVDVFFAFFVRI